MVEITNINEFCLGENLEEQALTPESEAEELLREGKTPSEIAGSMGISVTLAIQYLRTRVGDGSLRFSDIYFAFSSESRKILQAALPTKGANGDAEIPALPIHGLCREELELFESLRHWRVFAGDMYEYVSEIEIGAHQMVRDLLQQEFSSDRGDWWCKGVPEQIRQKCLSRSEEDKFLLEPFAYTDLIDLSKIIEKNWMIFNTFQDCGVSRRKFASDFSRLNRIRNAVMHPAKLRKWSEDDFEFVRTFRGTL